MITPSGALDTVVVSAAASASTLWLTVMSVEATVEERFGGAATGVLFAAVVFFGGVVSFAAVAFFAGAAFVAALFSPTAAFFATTGFFATTVSAAGATSRAEADFFGAPPLDAPPFDVVGTVPFGSDWAVVVPADPASVVPGDD
jgi:hypothetical protein